MPKIVLRESQAPYTVTVDEQTLHSEVTVLEQNGQPVAILLPVGEYEAFRAWQQRKQPLHRQAPSATFAQERAAFEKMLPNLYQDYPDKVVAIYQGKVVEIGDEVGETLEKVYNRYGYVACYAGRVELPVRVYKFPHRKVAPLQSAAAFDGATSHQRRVALGKALLMPVGIGGRCGAGRIQQGDLRGVNAQPTAPRFSRNCASLRAPMITLATVGRCSTQLIATWATVLPVSSATASSASTTR